ncbi:MAG: AbrB/MazE/SpoVT family DNA-binding domain-containing protein [Chlorobiaceae bacterium]|nr:AbrB/MazE/SpoVT family DNA-binding domain-containing protein [Chlorobiaceae bacterium]NTV60691.1 AbrB/MazE/SpoVT family DNA-binding domain-containing protein [Chlorobiaceae bacterium]
MSKIRVRKKNQITIPLRIAEQAGIKPDDILEISSSAGIVTLVPVGRKGKKRSALDYAGIARGVWGDTAEEIEMELKKDRDSWER